MKYSIVLSLLLVLTGCETAFNVTYTLLAAREQSLEESLKDEQGYSVTDCYGEFIGKKYAREFWKENNLPRGTTEFACKDYKAYLLNKVTDCQGKLLTSYPNGIMGFKEQHNFPRYELDTKAPGQIVFYTKFSCQNGQVVPKKCNE